MQIKFTPSGVCCKEMTIHLEGHLITDLQVVGGCAGNLSGLTALLKGMDVEDVIQRLQGTKCGMKDTSCPDQLTLALSSYLAAQSPQA